jgi:aryl-alcohol dehydrogenase-like predicted oxidoreductase
MRDVTALCLGTVKLGMPDYGFSSSLNRLQDPVSFLQQAGAQGISRFDTSPRYGTSEEILGQYIADAGIIPSVSSKIDGLKPSDPRTPLRMQESVRLSLARLHLEKLDICYLHQNELAIIADPCVHEGIARLKQQGLIRLFGASVYSLEECEYALGSGVFDIIQVPVSVFDLTFYQRFIRGNTSAVLFSARSLLLQGILVNRKAIDSRIRQSGQVAEYLQRLDRLAMDCGFTVLEIALAFVFSLPGIDHYLIGTSSIENLGKDMQCLKKELPVETFQRVTEMAETAKDWTNPRSWRSA